MKKFLLILGLLSAVTVAAGPKRVIITDYYTTRLKDSEPPPIPRSSLLRTIGHRLFPRAVKPNMYTLIDPAAG